MPQLLWAKTESLYSHETAPSERDVLEKRFMGTSLNSRGISLAADRCTFQHVNAPQDQSQLSDLTSLSNIREVSERAQRFTKLIGTTPDPSLGKAVLFFPFFVWPKEKAKSVFCCCELLFLPCLECKLAQEGFLSASDVGDSFVKFKLVVWECPESSGIRSCTWLKDWFALPKSVYSVPDTSCGSVAKPAEDKSVHATFSILANKAQGGLFGRLQTRNLSPFG